MNKMRREKREGFARGCQVRLQALFGRTAIDEGDLKQLEEACECLDRAKANGENALIHAQELDRILGIAERNPALALDLVDALVTLQKVAELEETRSDYIGRAALNRARIERATVREHLAKIVEALAIYYTPVVPDREAS